MSTPKVGMSADEIKSLQATLEDNGYYDGAIDGFWGPRTQAAFDLAMAAGKLKNEIDMPKSVVHNEKRSIAWSAKVSPEFVDKVIWIANALGMPEDGADFLMACMAWESGESFSPGVLNGAGSGATGLIQFMPSTAKGLGTTCQELAKMTPEAQLNYVYKHFLPFKNRLKTLADCYMTILWPAAVGKPDDHVLWWKESRPVIFRQNAGLDVNKDGCITKAECAAKVNEKLVKGMQDKYRRVIA